MSPGLLAPKGFGVVVVSSDLSREERLQIMLSPEELAAVDDWRFAKRMPSRAAAVRELLKRGLAAEGWDTASAGAKSGSYGVTENSSGTGTSKKKAGKKADGAE